MKRLLLALALLASPASAATVVLCDPAHEAVPGKVSALLRSAHTPDHQGDPNALISPDLSALSGVPVRHWRCTAQGLVVEMNAAQKAALDSWEKAASLASSRQAARVGYDEEILVKAIALEMTDQINLVRAAICTLHPATCAQLPPITYPQMRAAIRARLLELTPGDETTRIDREPEDRRGPQP